MNQQAMITAEEYLKRQATPPSVGTFDEQCFHISRYAEAQLKLYLEKGYDPCYYEHPEMFIAIFGNHLFDLMTRLKHVDPPNYLIPDDGPPTAL